ncbi:hypothetical protein AOLI_G00066930 [Acnodon oligacanthus]
MIIHHKIPLSSKPGLVRICCFRTWTFLDPEPPALPVSRYPGGDVGVSGCDRRVLLQNSSFFTALLSQMALESNQEMDQLLGNMIEMWVDRDGQTSLSLREENCPVWLCCPSCLRTTGEFLQ